VHNTNVVLPATFVEEYKRSNRSELSRFPGAASSAVPIFRAQRTWLASSTFSLATWRFPILPLKRTSSPISKGVRPRHSSLLHWDSFNYSSGPVSICPKFTAIMGGCRSGTTRRS